MDAVQAQDICEQEVPKAISSNEGSNSGPGDRWLAIAGGYMGCGAGLSVSKSTESVSVGLLCEATGHICGRWARACLLELTR